MDEPREKSRTLSKTTHGPAMSISSAPRPTTKATRILPVAGGVSFVVGGEGGFGVRCWPNARAGKQMRRRKKKDSGLSLVFMENSFQQDLQGSETVPCMAQEIRCILSCKTKR